MSCPIPSPMGKTKMVISQLLIKIEWWCLVHMKGLWKHFQDFIIWLQWYHFPGNHQYKMSKNQEIAILSLFFISKYDFQCQLLFSIDCQTKQEKQCTGQLQVWSPWGVCFVGHFLFVLHLVAREFCIWLLGILPWTFFWNLTANYFQTPFIWAIDHVSITKRTWDVAICIWLLGSFASGC